ncbi:hypothetical protein SDRG_03335 [Saprolegnia diclina VS20]|uniref:Uncharacterized protein n=1 Tax=Saprolegnia diclina (strain VS20) TaxID=1156394 RepID=T0S8Z2_SAPDV|nr:hypothetical protein SDRG_03335 [Saprolegnia diclina VS20]EQC39127.1 hypothetical protein SDRG_03335 [Saprolegnia diclina VS20]|eukprot:XP_008607188.1 hypothetical protein SDRG_03335 [Saprolegnia diclina VS20]
MEYSARMQSPGNVLVDRGLFRLITSFQDGLFLDVIALFKAWAAMPLPTKIASMRDFLLEAMTEPLLVLHGAIAQNDARLVDLVLRCTHVKSAHAMDFASKTGALSVVRYLHTSGHAPSRRAMDYAAQNGHVEIVAFLHEHRREGCTRDAMDFAAQNGHLAVVEFLATAVNVGGTVKAMDWAARNGHLNVLRYLHEHRPEGCSAYAMDSAAKNGHVHVLRYLHSIDAPASHLALDAAAANGHMEAVQFLHMHRDEGCTVRAMDGAARFGLLDTVVFLHTHRTEGCSTEAVDAAAANGHEDVVRFLLTHRHEGASPFALHAAAVSGYVNILDCLHAHVPTMVCTSRALLHVVQVGQLAALRWLLDYQRGALDAIRDDLMERAITYDRREIVEELWASRLYTHVREGWVELAIEKHRPEIASYLTSRRH